MSDKDMKVFASGAKRAKDEARFDLIPRSGLTRLAARYTMGARKYGEHNWQKGLADPEYVAQFKAHMAAHMMNFFEEGCEKDDNLAAIAWATMALMEVEERHGHSGVRSRTSIERDREGESSAQAAADQRHSEMRGDTRGGGRRSTERSVGLIATGVASPPAGTPEISAVNLQCIAFHSGVAKRAPKRGDRAGRSDGTKLATNVSGTGRKSKRKAGGNRR